MNTTPKPVILTGSTDTRGVVAGAEQERLASGFGSTLRSMRERNGLTLQQLGDLAGVGKPHLSKLERGERRPSVDLIRAVCRVYGPSDAHREALETRLAELAGESLREGAQRKKRRVEAKARREARAIFKQQVSKTRRHIAQLEAAGRPVPDVLRKMASSELADRIAGHDIPDEPGIKVRGQFKSAQDRLAEAKSMQNMSLVELAKYMKVQ